MQLFLYSIRVPFESALFFRNQPCRCSALAAVMWPPVTSTLNSTSLPAVCSPHPSPRKSTRTSPPPPPPYTGATARGSSSLPPTTGAVLCPPPLLPKATVPSHRRFSWAIALAPMRLAVRYRQRLGSTSPRTSSPPPRHPKSPQALSFLRWSGSQRRVRQLRSVFNQHERLDAPSEFRGGSAAPLVVQPFRVCPQQTPRVFQSRVSALHQRRSFRSALVCLG